MPRAADGGSKRRNFSEMNGDTECGFTPTGLVFRRWNAAGLSCDELSRRQYETEGNASGDTGSTWSAESASAKLRLKPGSTSRPQTRVIALETASAATGVKPTKKNYTNEDVQQENQKNGYVHYDSKTEKIQ